jgi:hypothetical protein
MKAVYEYENGELGETVGLQGFGKDIVERVLKEHDVVKVWLIQDGEGDESIDYGAPDWELETWWVTRADGAVAKVNLGAYRPDGDDLWTAMEEQYPEAWDRIPEGGVEWGGTTEYRLWDLQVWPGQGERLAAWLGEGSE